MSLLRAYLIGPAASPNGGQATVVLVEPNGDEGKVNCVFRGQTMEIGFLNGQEPDYYHQRYGGPNMVSSVIRRAALGISRRESGPQEGSGPYERAKFLELRTTEAFEFARKALAGHVVPGSGTPYLGRAMAVSALAIEYGADEDEAIAALLLHTVSISEDPLIQEEILRLFGARVQRIILNVEPKTSGEPNLVSADSSELLVLMADRLHEIASLAESRRAWGPIFESSQTAFRYGGTLAEAVRRHAECTPSIALMVDRLERALNDLKNF